MRYRPDLSWQKDPGQCSHCRCSSRVVICRTSLKRRPRPYSTSHPTLSKERISGSLWCHRRNTTGFRMMRGHFDCLTPSSLGLAPAPALTPSRWTGFFYLCNSKITNSVAAPASCNGGAGTALAAMSHSSTPLSSLLLTSGSFSGKYSSSLSLTVISVYRHCPSPQTPFLHHCLNHRQETP